MAQTIHLRCRHCGRKLASSQSSYCPPCNLYLFYRAMPILLGMMMTGQRVPHPVRKNVAGRGFPAEKPRGYDDKSVLYWE